MFKNKQKVVSNKREEWSCKCGRVIYDDKGLRVDFKKRLDCDNCFLKLAIEYNLNRIFIKKPKK